MPKLVGGSRRGDDSFGEDCGGPEYLDAQDIPRIAELDGDAGRGFNQSGDLARVADQVEHISLGVISDLKFYNSHLLSLSPASASTKA